MEIVLVCVAIVGALILFAPPAQPSPRPEVILIQSRLEPQPVSDLGCLPLLACVILVIVVMSAL